MEALFLERSSCVISSPPLVLLKVRRSICLAVGGIIVVVLRSESRTSQTKNTTRDERTRSFLVLHPRIHSQASRLRMPLRLRTSPVIRLRIFRRRLIPFQATRLRILHRLRIPFPPTNLLMSNHLRTTTRLHIVSRLRILYPATRLLRQYSVPNNQSGHAQSSSYSLPSNQSGHGQSSSYSLPPTHSTATPSTYSRWMGYTPTNGGGIPIPGDSPRPYSPFVPLNLNRGPANQAPPQSPSPYVPSSSNGHVAPPAVARPPSRQVYHAPDVEMPKAAETTTHRRSPSPIPFPDRNKAVSRPTRSRSPVASPSTHSSIAAPVVAPDSLPHVDRAPEMEPPPVNHAPEIEMGSADVPTPSRTRSPLLSNNVAPAQALPDPSSSIPSPTATPAAAPSAVVPAPHRWSAHQRSTCLAWRQRYLGA
ncbi:hypothetical protein FB451DRAFT_620650 [Mycena latifolia]|nr:hypothetical protein FB451DRAFT_620650 [Mycena latifolia]